MKYFFMFMLLSSIMSNFAFAIETTTDCPMMREANDRSNPKANLASIKAKPRTRSGSSAQ
jgi:hypothetical protein